MKNILVLGVLFFSINVFAQSGVLDEVPDDACPRSVELKGDILLCTGVEDARMLLSVNTYRKITKLPRKVNFKDAVELDILPDDCTSMAYLYSSELIKAGGKVVGYIVVSGYTNDEMDMRLQLTTRYNLAGELTSIKLGSF